MIGGSRTAVWGCGGADQDASALGGHVMFANGLAMPPPPSVPSFALPPPNGLSLGKDRLPSPAFCRAILVPILFKNDMAVLTLVRITYSGL